MTRRPDRIDVASLPLSRRSALQALAPPAHRPGVATWARGDVVTIATDVRRRLAAIRQVMAVATQATERPGVATWARGDGGDHRCRLVVRRLAAIRQVMAHGRPLVPASRRGHGATVARRLAAIRQVMAGAAGPGRNARRRDVGTRRRWWSRSGR